MTITIATNEKRQVIDITDRIEAELRGSGLVNMFVLHTTAAVMMAELDPGTDVDYLQALQALTPDAAWRHPHDPSHFPDHLWGSLIGPSLTVPYEDGKLVVGTWQRIVLIELDGPREREIAVTYIPAQ